jgi:CMP/dCMP kinase
MSEPTRRVVIAIDGPSGAGKSTIGRALAEALSYTYLDTGAMYRAVAVRAIEKGIAAEDEAALAGAASSARITFDATGKRVLLDGRDVTEEIRTREATRMASAIAKVSGVRRELVRQQQELGRQGGVVLDGRDIGSVVFPRAEVKFYLDAAPEKRAQRRLAESQTPDGSLQAVLDDIRARDHQDMTRATSPLVRTTDAVYVDTTEMSPREVTAHLLAVTQGRIRVISQS